MPSFEFSFTTQCTRKARWYIYYIQLSSHGQQQANPILQMGFQCFLLCTAQRSPESTPREYTKIPHDMFNLENFANFFNLNASGLQNATSETRIVKIGLVFKKFLDKNSQTRSGDQTTATSSLVEKHSNFTNQYYNNWVQMPLKVYLQFCCQLSDTALP